MNVDELVKKLTIKEEKSKELEKENLNSATLNNDLSQQINNRDSDKATKEESLIKDEIISNYKTEIKKTKDELKIVNRKKIDLGNEIIVLNYISKLNELKKLDCSYHKKHLDKKEPEFINFRNNLKF